MSNDPYRSPDAPSAPAATTPGIAVQQPSQPFGSGSGQRKKGLLIAGVLVLLAGVGGGLAALATSGSAVDEAVESLARAPVGCTTTLDFDSTGTFTVYVETKGTANVGRGDCPGNDEDYERDADDLPDVDLVLVPEDSDDPIDVDDDDGTSYDAAGSAGQSIGRFEIEEAGEYELTVTMDDGDGDDGDADFAIAIGKDPEAAADTLKLLSYVLIGLGIVLGGLLILLGLRRKPHPTAGGMSPVTYRSEQQPPSSYQPTGVHPPAPTPPSPPSFGGGFGPPTVTRPADPNAPTQQTPSSPQWPAPPTR